MTEDNETKYDEIELQLQPINVEMKNYRALQSIDLEISSVIYSVGHIAKDMAEIKGTVEGLPDLVDVLIDHAQGIRE